MEAESRKIPSHELTYARLRDMILYGHIPPGSAVTIQGLIADLGAGMTPVREALRRLTAEGALDLQGNRRVVVPRLSDTLLAQVSFARLTIEPELAILAARHLTPALIGELEAIDAKLDAAIRARDIPAYLEQNHAFHFRLYEASQAPVLVDIARSMWLRFGPSLRVVCVRFDEWALPDRHLEALNAMRAGDAKALQSAIKSDVEQGLDQVRLALQQGAI